MITNYNELPIGKYLQIADILKGADDPNAVSLQILSVLSGMTEDELLDLPMEEFSRLMGKATFILEPPQSKVAMPRYTLGDMVLDVNVNVAKMTAAQYIDFQTYCKNPEKNYIEILSCFMIPHGHKYNKDYDVADVQAAIRDYLPTNSANGIYAFFLRKSQKSMRSILSSSVKMLTKNKTRTDKGEKMRTEAIAKMKSALHSLESGAGSAV